MAKKKKPSSAQDLIDSLLDDSSEDGAVQAPQAPALPEKFLNKKREINYDELDKSIVFEIDPKKAEPTRTLALVTDKTKPTETPVDQIRNAATVVQSGANSQSDVNFEEFSSPVVPDKTVRIPATGAQQPTAERPPRIESAISVESRYKPANVAVGGPMPSPSEVNLKQSEGLRAAQARIHELENELDRLRRDSEQLASAGETLRRRTDELLAKSENLENQLRESTTTAEEEKKIMRSQLAAKDRENGELRSKLEEAETRLEGNFKKIRVRERELEHRLEIVKMESQTLVSTKDDMIMRLKREIDQMKFEIENSKVRSQELYNQYKEKQETARRVVRALRIALTILEGDEDPGLKKAE